MPVRHFTSRSTRSTNNFFRTVYLISVFIGLRNPSFTSCPYQCGFGYGNDYFSVTVTVTVNFIFQLILSVTNLRTKTESANSS